MAPVRDLIFMILWRDLVLIFTIAIRFIADDKGAFTGALGLLFDASPLFGAPRAKVRLLPHRLSIQLFVDQKPNVQRFVLVTDGHKITHVAVEEDPSQVTVTASDKVLAQL